MSVLLGLRSSLCLTSNRRLASSLVSSRSSTAIPSGRRQTARLALALSGSVAAVYVSWTNKAECSPPAPAVETPVAVPVMGKYDGENEADEDNGEDPMEKLIDMFGPYVMKCGFGGAMGFCSGLAARKLGMVVAYLVGVGFIGVQVAAYNGYIDVDWYAIKDEAVKILDVDGDGKLDAEDAKLWWRKFKETMANALPSSSGFAGGFVLGLRYG